MTILLSHTTALEYWRAADSPFSQNAAERKRAMLCARKTLAACKPRIADVSDACRDLGFPLEVLVGSKALRTRSKAFDSRVWTAGFPEGSIARIGDGVLASTPEFCFLQMAPQLSLVELILLGFELCGTYSRSVQGQTRYRDFSLTSAANIAAFLDSAKGISGVNKARRAIAYVLDASASPMETAFAAMLCLPYTLGGYGFPSPTLNFEIDVPNRLRRDAGQNRFVSDLCWRNLCLTCEYDSDMFHSDAFAREKDSRQRNALLLLMGYRVVTVSRGQVLDSGSFNMLAKQLARAMGRRLRYRDPDFTRAHLALRRKALEFGMNSRLAQ